jgi:ABC-type bacteriocin/lantibiotic exporter with double-glycine peptidase domain
MATLENLLSKMVEKINNKVSLDSQSLTEAQKSQVRNNIGACALTTTD